MSSTDVFADVWSRMGHNGVTSYRCEIQVRDLMVGGIPADPDVQRRWLASRLELDDPRLEELLRETVEQTDSVMSVEEKVDALIKGGAVSKGNVFGRLPNGQPTFPGRCMKAALKEFANSAYPGNTWPGKKEKFGDGFKKGLMNTLAERVFVAEHVIPLYADSPPHREERIKHVNGPKGPTSCITQVEVLEHPRFVCQIRVHDDFIPRDVWARIWERGEDLGIGADRGRSDGQFDLVAWEKFS